MFHWYVTMKFKRFLLKSVSICVLRPGLFSSHVSDERVISCVLFHCRLAVIQPLRRNHHRRHHYKLFKPPDTLSPLNKLCTSNDFTNEQTRDRETIKESPRQVV